MLSMLKTLIFNLYQESLKSLTLRWAHIYSSIWFQCTQNYHCRPSGSGDSSFRTLAAEFARCNSPPTSAIIEDFPQPLVSTKIPTKLTHDKFNARSGQCEFSLGFIWSLSTSVHYLWLPLYFPVPNLVNSRSPRLGAWSSVMLPMWTSGGLINPAIICNLDFPPFPTLPLATDLIAPSLSWRMWIPSLICLMHCLLRECRWWVFFLPVCHVSQFCSNLHQNINRQFRHWRCNWALLILAIVMACVIYIWDYALLFSVEVDLVWKSKWSFMKGLYLFQRYLPFINITTRLYCQSNFPQCSYPKFFLH